jgi:hypothetical protein
MRVLSPLTPEKLARAEDLLRNPRPGSRIEAARNYGVDLTLLIEQLRLSPAQRARKLQDATEAIESVRGIARKRT